MYGFSLAPATAAPAGMHHAVLAQGVPSPPGATHGAHCALVLLSKKAVQGWSPASWRWFRRCSLLWCAQCGTWPVLQHCPLSGWHMEVGSSEAMVAHCAVGAVGAVATHVYPMGTIGATACTLCLRKGNRACKACMHCVTTCHGWHTLPWMAHPAMDGTPCHGWHTLPWMANTQAAWLRISDQVVPD